MIEDCSDLICRLPVKQCDGQVALDPVIDGHHRFRLQYMHDFDVWLFRQPGIHLQFAGRINVSRKIAEYFGPYTSHSAPIDPFDGRVFQRRFDASSFK